MKKKKRGTGPCKSAGPKAPATSPHKAEMVAMNAKHPRTSGYRKASEIPTCRGCGCTDANACDGGCFWVEPDLCSKCVTPEQANAFLTEYYHVRNWTRHHPRRE